MSMWLCFCTTQYTNGFIPKEVFRCIYVHIFRSIHILWFCIYIHKLHSHGYVEENYFSNHNYKGTNKNPKPDNPWHSNKLNLRKQKETTEQNVASHTHHEKSGVYHYQGPRLQQHPQTHLFVKASFLQQAPAFQIPPLHKTAFGCTKSTSPCYFSFHLKHPVACILFPAAP